MEVVRTRSPGASSYQAHMLQLSSSARLSFSSLPEDSTKKVTFLRLFVEENSKSEVCDKKKISDQDNGRGGAILSNTKPNRCGEL